jgi:predicted peptidase
MKQCFALRKLAMLFCTLVFFLSGCKKGDVPTESPAISISSTPPITTILFPITTPVAPGVNGYYISMPSNYDQTTDNYPLLIYIPGAGQFGNGSFDLPLLLKAGPAELADEKRLPGTFKVNGKTFSLLVFTPQFNGPPGISVINDCIEYAKNTYRVDSSRIYLSGLSMGSVAACDLAGVLPGKLAAIIPMAGVSYDYDSTNKCQQIAGSNLPVWVFHSDDDPQINVTMAKEFTGKINSFNPAIRAKLTVWPNGGHDAWTRAIEPMYKENGMNIYEWMLQYHR